MAMDYYGQVRVARDEGEKPEKVRNMLREERKRKRHGLSKNPRWSWRPNKRYRFSGYKWLNEVNNAIRVSTDQPGLQAFKLADNILDRGPPETWPRLTIAADRGVDGVTALGFCRRHLKLNVDYTPDPSHDVTNDIDLALERADLKNMVTLGIVERNTPHGPW